MLGQNTRNTTFAVEIVIVMQYIQKDRSIVTNSFSVLNGRKHGISRWPFPLLSDPLPSSNSNTNRSVATH